MDQSICMVVPSESEGGSKSWRSCSGCTASASVSDINENTCLSQHPNENLACK